MQDAAQRARTASTTGDRMRSMRSLISVTRKLSSNSLIPGSATRSSSNNRSSHKRRAIPVSSVISASLAALVNDGLDAGSYDNDNDDRGGGNSTLRDTGYVSAQPPEASQHVGDSSGDDGDGNDDGVDSAAHHALALQVEMLRGKLARRNEILEVIRRAYYHDVIIVKEELRHSAKLGSHSASGSSRNLQHQQQPQQQSSDDRLSAVPSVDLRDVLPLFAPSETVLKVHPCEMCGGHLELVHGESKEVEAARQEMMRATKGEQQMRSVVHRMRTEAQEKEVVHDALQQHVKALAKENAFALEQLQAARKAERDQKTNITALRTKLQIALATQDEVDRLTSELKDTQQELIRSNHDRDISSASNNHLKEELAEVSKALHQTKVQTAQIESDFGTTFYRLQEEIKKSKQLADDLAAQQLLLKDKTTVNSELQSSLVALKDELSTTLQRFEQTKRHLEDQLIEEERAREEMQEQNLEFRKTNKRLAKELESAKSGDVSNGLGGGSAASGANAAGGSGGNNSKQHPSGVTPAELKGILHKRLDALQTQLERSQMRENDLLALLCRQAATIATAASAAAAATAQTSATPKPTPVRRVLSRMPSTTIITRFVPSADTAAAKTDGNSSASGATSNGIPDIGATRQRSSGHAPGALTPNGENVDESERDGFDAFDGGDSDFLSGSDAMRDMDDKNFEAYTHEVHRLLTEIEDGRSKNQKQQKTIADMERKHQALNDRLEESKLMIESLTGSVKALKMRLNQDSAGAAEELEDMLRQLDDGKRAELYEAEKAAVLNNALRSISNKVFELSDNALLQVDISIDFPNFDDDRFSAPPPTSNGTNGSDSVVPDLYRKKQELRRKVMLEKEMKKFQQQCHSRSEIIGLELRRLRDTIDAMRNELDDAENKIDSDALQLRSLEADVAKLRLTVEMGKNNIQRTEKALKTATEDFESAQAGSEARRCELDALRSEHNSLQVDQKRLTMTLFEKTKAWEREISTNDKNNLKTTKLEASLLSMTASRDALHRKLQDIDERAEYRRQTNRSVEVSVTVATTESEMQTDAWKPTGLVLRQRNSTDRMPQRFLGKASVLIACPDFSAPARSSTAPTSSSGSANQELGGTTSFLDASGSGATEHRRELLELTLYPPAKAGGRQIKTSHGSSRPKALSKLFLSSDGVSQRYISQSPRQDTSSSSSNSNSTGVGANVAQQQQRVRPFTSQG